MTDPSRPANPLESLGFSPQAIAVDAPVIPRGPCDACGGVVLCVAVADRHVCGRCLERSLVALVAAHPTARLRLYEFQGLLCVARDVCDQIRAELRERLAGRFQRELWAARDPDPYGATLAEAERMNVSLTLSRYTHDRAAALAAEANVTLSAWIRQAITLAFRTTEARQRLDE